MNEPLTSRPSNGSDVHELTQSYDSTVEAVQAYASRNPSELIPNFQTLISESRAFTNWVNANEGIVTRSLEQSRSSRPGTAGAA